jgi:hypothetical protein
MPTTSGNRHTTPENPHQKSNKVIQIKKVNWQANITIQSPIHPKHMLQRGPNTILPPKKLTQILQLHPIPHDWKQTIHRVNHLPNIYPPVIKIMQRNR